MKYLKLFENFDEGPRYKISQKVVALSNSGPNATQTRIKGKIYTIDSILFCSGCGKQYLNFGMKAGGLLFFAGNNVREYGTCTCGTETHAKGLFWSPSICYAPIDDIDAQIAKAIEEEDYELAASLRDIDKELV